MARTGTFLCTKQNGRPKIWDRQGLDAVLAQYGDGEDYNLTIEEVGRKRTNAQNKFFWVAIVPAFMKEGRGRQEAHDMLCLMLIPKEIELPDGTYVRVPGHTSALNVAEFNQFLEECIKLAAENGVYVEDADEWRLRVRREAQRQAVVA